MNFNSKKTYVGKKLKELREEKGLTLKEVGTEFGMKPQTLSNYEKGKRSIDIDILFELAQFYNVSIDYLFGLCNTSEPRVNYEETNEMNGLGYSQEVYNLLWESPSFNQLLNDMTKHPLFMTLEKLTYNSRYTEYDEIDSGYRSFLVSKVLYEIISDIFDNWYYDNPANIQMLSKAEKAKISKEIQDYLDQKETLDNINITDNPEKFIETEYEIHCKLQHLYLKLKKYL